MRAPLRSAPCLLVLLALLLGLFAGSPASTQGPPPPRRYYAHAVVEDRFGVIAPWYRGLNGQCDWRVRIAAETLKRYPWTSTPRPVPHYVFNGTWAIAPDGTISIPTLRDWDNADLGQRAAYVLSGLVDYYRYSGDPAAIAHISLAADAILHYCQTDRRHAWPRFLISVPTHGEPYGRADPHGLIQLDITAEVGLALVRAYELVGNPRWLEAAGRWGDELAANARLRPHGSLSPWNRYANPEDAAWEDHQTGGAVFILAFFDELLRVGHRGPGGAIPRARAAGVAYVRDVLLPRWTVNDTWGRNYWDWPDPVQAENVTEFAARYLIEHPREFPRWRTDARNLLALFINHTSVAPDSAGDIFSGAWAYPESSGCCGRSLWYGPMELATIWAQYGVVTNDEWAREMARRQILLSTYDGHETGVVEDNIDGGPIVAGAWFKIAHPMALKHVLGTMAWLPDLLGANRENHLMRSSAVVRSVSYEPGRVSYETYDAPPGTTDVLRLAFAPASVTADGRALARTAARPRGYTVRMLRNGDSIVTVRHDGARRVIVQGASQGTLADPQRQVPARNLAYSGTWSAAGTARWAAQPGAEARLTFTGNQVRLLGSVGPDGGRADVYVDGRRQLVGVDQWCPQVRTRQTVYTANGLPSRSHTLRLVVLGTGNPVSRGARIRLDGAAWSAARGEAGSGEGGGPTTAQRVIFGRADRSDYQDTAGHAWRPALEWIVRSGSLADSVTAAWWTEPRRDRIAGTRDPELYRYGAHAPELRHVFTVGPGTYHLRIKLAETRPAEPSARAMSIYVNDVPFVRRLDIAATAGGLYRAVDLVTNGIRPSHGVVQVRLVGEGGEAIVQAMALGPGPGGRGASPVTLPAASSAQGGNLLANPGFEQTVAGQLGELGQKGAAAGWTYLFAGPTRSYIWGESDYSIHPDWGLPVIRSGKQALRTHTEGEGHTIVYQEAAVVPAAAYRASVWVNAVDLHGKGFGTRPGDSAGLVVQELDRSGSLVLAHAKAAVVRAGPYVEVSVPFRASATTVRVRFILDTVIGGPYNEGHVTYDDAELRRGP